MTVHYSGFVAIIGRPNVGKSTLINQLIQKKISITSAKPQTTRLAILGIKTMDERQIIYVDTPGLHDASDKNAVNRYMNRVANAALVDTDVIIWVVEATLWRHEDEVILKKLTHIKAPVFLALNKVDLLKDKGQLLPLMDQLKNKFPFEAIIPISALKGLHVQELEEKVSKYLPPGPALYPEDHVTDKNIRFQIAEIIREKVIQETHQELPYTTAIEIEQLKDTTTKQKPLTEISAVIWVERQGQKIIVIGTGGARLKKIGSAARKDIEALIGHKVFLRLWIKVKSHWTDDERALKSLGYE